MYLAIDGTQYQVRKIFHLFNLKNVFFQYIKIPNDGQKPFTFQNKANEIVQAIPIGVISDINQSVVSLFDTNENCFTCKYFSVKQKYLIAIFK